MNDMLFSIVVTNYNYGKYLPRVFASLTDQGELLERAEVILVDDGSSDDSIQVARQLAKGFQLDFKLIETPRLGKPGPVRNAGLSGAQGRFMLCLDADDFLAPGYLNACHEALNIHSEAGFAYPDSVYLEPAGPRVVLSPEYDRSVLLTQNFVPFAALMRREAWDAGARYRDNTGYEDWDFWIQTALLGFKGVRVPLPLYFHHRHGSGYFDTAVQQDARSKATIVLNNKAAFAQEVRDWARAVHEGQDWALGMGRGLIPRPDDVARMRKVHDGERRSLRGTRRHRPGMAVRQHTLMQSQGGAARVADLLCRGLPGSQWACSRSWELEDGGTVPGLHLEATALGSSLEKEEVAHLHSSRNWPVLLESLTGRKVVITVHDERLFTGGCPYHLDCENWEQECRGSCPAGIANAAQHRAVIRESLLGAEPLLVAPSGWMARQIRRAVPELTCRVVPNGVPWPREFPDKNQAKQSLGLPSEARVVMFVAHGGIKAGLKGGGRWMDIWGKIKADVPNCLGFFAGGEKFERLGDLTVWPYLPHRELDRLLAAADVLAYPTLADNQPLVVLEAFAQGTPVVSFDVGGLCEQIRTGENGRLFSPRNWEALAKGCAELLTDPVRARRLGREAFLSGRGRFSLERMAAAHAAVYRGLGRANSASSFRTTLDAELRDGKDRFRSRWR